MGEGIQRVTSSSNKCINPSLGIVNCWQGIVEIILRAVTIVSLIFYITILNVVDGGY